MNNVNPYVVQTGDTLYGIAKRFDTNVQSIRELNSLDSDVIVPGQRLIISSNGEEEPSECLTYTVKKGDTLFMGNNEY